MKLRACGFEIVANLSQDLSQSPTRRREEGFGGKAVEADDQTRTNLNDATANERERVGIRFSRDFLVPVLINSSVTLRGVFY